MSPQPHSDLGFTPAAPSSNPHADLGFTPSDQPKPTTTEAPMTVGGFLLNDLKSAGRFAADLAGPLLHPAKTLEGVTGLMEGMAEKGGAPAINGQSHAQYVDALVKMYKDRYGSLDNFRKTLYNDPVGVLSDVATLAGGTGLAAKGVELGADAAKLGSVADLARTVGKGAQVASEATNPLSLAGKVAEALPGKAISAALTRGALKGGYTVNTPAADIAGAVQASQDLGNVPFSQAGLDKINGALADVRKEIVSRTSSAAAGGVTIDPKRVQLRLDALRAQYGMQVNPDKDLADIDKVADTFARNNHNPIPIDQAQAVKVGSNAVLSGKYGKASTAQLESEKALTRGLKEEIENAIPEISGLNDKQAKLMDLEGILGKAVNKYVNSDGFLGGVKRNLGTHAGLTLGGAGGAAAIASHNPEFVGAGLALQTMQAVLADPAIKQRLAIMVNKAQQLNPSKYGVPSMANALTRVNEYANSFTPKPDSQQQPATPPAQITTNRPGFGQLQPQR